MKGWIEVSHWLVQDVGIAKATVRWHNSPSPSDVDLLLAQARISGSILPSSTVIATLSPEKIVAVAGQPLEFDLTVTNGTEAPLDFGDADFNYQIADVDGERVAEMRISSRNPAHLVPYFGTASPTAPLGVLPPGGSAVRHFSLPSRYSGWRDLEPGGRYTISVGIEPEYTVRAVAVGAVHVLPAPSSDPSSSVQGR